jgi:hypothetical protein
MDQNIKAVYARVAAGVHIDEMLIKRLQRYVTEFTHRNPDHLDFFSGNLLGVEKVRFKSSDWDNFFDEVVRVDDVELRTELMQLPVFEPYGQVGRDVMNITCMWLIHTIYSSHLKDTLKQQGMRCAALIFNYKVLTSKLAHDFKFPADRETAIAVYAELNKKYSLKKHGSWSALLDARAEDMIREGGLHWSTIQNFTPDAGTPGVLYMVTDSQGRIRDLIKTLWEVLERVRKSDAKIITTGSHITIDGVAEVGDMTRHLLTYKHYIHSVAGTHDSFIKSDLVDVIGMAMHTMNPDYFLQTLVHISDQYHGRDSERYESLLDETMIHAFTLLAKERQQRNRGFDLANIIVKLRGVYMSARTQDPYMLELRRLADEIVGESLRGRAASAQAAVRTGVLLYIVLRALTRSYYA